MINPFIQVCKRISKKYIVSLSKSMIKRMELDTARSLRDIERLRPGFIVHTKRVYG